MPENQTTIFTDGASRGNPGPGGWGAVLIRAEGTGARVENTVTELGGREDQTTNNRMELMAAIKALSSLASTLHPLPCTLFTDSKYLIEGITKWVFGWQKSGWKTKTKEDVANRDLWERLLDATDGKNIEWKYLGGHVGIAGNERADEIATAFADGKDEKLFSGPIEKYGKDILNISHSPAQLFEKKVRRASSKAKAYSYVSLVDGKVEKHATWAQCEKRVNGTRAKFRKTLSAEDEKALIAEWS